MEELLQAALDHATFAGASYTDVRAVEIESETLSVTGPSVEALDTGYSLGFGVRVLADGAWGHAASAKLEPSEFERVARAAVDVARAAATASAAPVELVPEPVHRARWATPVVLDPWRVPLEDKLELLTSAAGLIEATRGVDIGRATMDFIRQRTRFASSEGSEIDQTIVHSGAGIEAVAIGDGEIQQRSYPASFRGHFEAGGYEIVNAMDLTGHAERTAEEAAQLLAA